MTSWRYAAATDTGLVRADNQDAYFVNGGLAVIADGMGGHAAGEVAAAMAIEIMREVFGADPSVEGLVDSIDRANVRVVEDARANPEHFGMATTVIAVGLTTSGEGTTSPTLVHVGDSRAYQLRDGALRQLSEDHSVAEEWVRLGRLTPAEAAVHPRRHQLTRGVGVEASIEVDVFALDALAGDRLLLCSDGLSNELDADTIANLASPPHELEDAVESLVKAAKLAGGRDNITAVLVEFDEVSERPTADLSRALAAPSPAPVAIAPAAPPSLPGRPRRRVTWRVVASVVVLVAVAAGAVAVLHWYAYSTYYLANDHGVVAIYRGQPGGVLWYHPVKVNDTRLPLKHLLASDRQLLDATISEPTYAAATTETRYLYASWSRAKQAAVSTVTTTTTTAPTTDEATTTTSTSTTTTTTTGGA